MPPKTNLSEPLDSKKAVRIIGKLNYRESCRESFRELELLTLPCIYIYDVIMYCRSKCTMVRGEDIHRCETRGRGNYRAQHHRLTLTQHLSQQWKHIIDLLLSVDTTEAERGGVTTVKKTSREKGASGGEGEIITEYQSTPNLLDYKGILIYPPSPTEQNQQGDSLITWLQSRTSRVTVMLKGIHLKIRNQMKEPPFVL
ncbi:hypothetical protein J6590_025043 [Homalodisca vitripennis]|nr:hypothetical protein J6590_025043 [Homalodisca vitripennis]